MCGNNCKMTFKSVKVFKEKCRFFSGHCVGCHRMQIAWALLCRGRAHSAWLYTVSRKTCHHIFVDLWFQNSISDALLGKFALKRHQRFDHILGASLHYLVKYKFSKSSLTEEQQRQTKGAWTKEVVITVYRWADTKPSGPCSHNFIVQSPRIAQRKKRNVLPEP